MDWEMKFIAVVAFLAVGVILISSYFALYESTFYVPTVSGENISVYKSSCTEIDLNKPLTDLESFYGQKVKVKGEVVESFGLIPDDTIMLKTENLHSYPFIIVSYPIKTMFNGSDEVEVYGEYGAYIELEKNTVPFIKATYIEKI
jgi:hypothetical protein